MNKNPDIICCGHAAYDLNFIMDEYPVEDEKYKIDELIQTGGGPAANAASLLALWGVKTAFAGLAGDDIYGRLIKEELVEAGVDISLLQLDKNKNTPLSAVIVNTATGSRTLLNRRNSTDQPAVSAETTALLSQMTPTVLHFDGHALDLSLKMIKLFPEAKIVMDAGSLRPSTDRLCAAADYAVCSRKYAEEASGLEDIVSEEGRRRCLGMLSKKYPGCIIVTLGAKGLFCGNRNASGEPVLQSVNAFRVKAVDSTGAGDIFHAAFSYGLLKGFSLEKNLRFSSAAAALSVTKPGGRTSIPSLEDTAALAGRT